VKAAPFRYERPRELTTALTLVRDPEAKALAGGQSLVPVMAMRLARPRVLVDLNRIDGLAKLERIGDELITGATVRQRTLERRPGLATELPLVAAALPFVGHREVRNRGTVGGSVAHADPSAELGLVAATLKATIEARSLDGQREIGAEEFITGPFQTRLDPGELLTAIRWPIAKPGDGFAFEEVARRHGDFALCGVAVHVHEGSARVGLLGVGPRPEVHNVADVSDPEQVADELAEKIDPPSDMHASAGYRRRLVQVLVARALGRASG
jgi:carbon-monoxide dehydrogenase medium subunit